jgi:hypothetical protein
MLARTNRAVGGGSVNRAPITKSGDLTEVNGWVVARDGSNRRPSASSDRRFGRYRMERALRSEAVCRPPDTLNEPELSPWLLGHDTTSGALRGPTYGCASAWLYGHVSDGDPGQRIVGT